MAKSFPLIEQAARLCCYSSLININPSEEKKEAVIFFPDLSKDNVFLLLEKGWHGGPVKAKSPKFSVVHDIHIIGKGKVLEQYYDVLKSLY